MPATNTPAVFQPPPPSWRHLLHLDHCLLSPCQQTLLLPGLTRTPVTLDLCGPYSTHIKPSVLCLPSTVEIEEMSHYRHRIWLSELLLKGEMLRSGRVSSQGGEP